MFKRSGVINNINALNFVTKPVAVTHVGYLKRRVGVFGKSLCQEKKLAFFVVKTNKLLDRMCFQELLDKIAANRAACAGYQDSAFI